jgi:two-component system, cell cycle response regulator
MTTLLIVDDEPTILRAMEMALEMEGFVVKSANTAPEALEQLDGVDLVLTDLSMPDVDGLELLREIRKREPTMPVAIMTAYASVESALRAMQEGAYDYLLKPCHVDEIVLKVRLGLRLGRYEHELRARNEELERIKSELEAANRRLELQARTDSLTSLPNRRRFMERLREEVAKSRRYHDPLSLLAIDVDHFKRINDTYGHPIGDKVLQEIGAILLERARETDLPARIGGEEFAVILPSTKLEGAKWLAESLRERIAKYQFPEIGKLSISIGVATYDPLVEAMRRDQHGERLLSLADEALYRAKANGRNRVELTPATDPQDSADEGQTKDELRKHDVKAARRK